MGAHTLLQSVIIQKRGSGGVLGEGLEVKNEKKRKKKTPSKQTKQNIVHSKLHQKESQNLHESAKTIP